jgi:hypothetical protein
MCRGQREVPGSEHEQPSVGILVSVLAAPQGGAVPGVDLLTARMVRRQAGGVWDGQCSTCMAASHP